MDGQMLGQGSHVGWNGSCYVVIVEVASQQVLRTLAGCKGVVKVVMVVAMGMEVGAILVSRVVIRW